MSSLIFYSSKRRACCFQRKLRLKKRLLQMILMCSTFFSAEFGATQSNLINSPVDAFKERASFFIFSFHSSADEIFERLTNSSIPKSERDFSSKSNYQVKKIKAYLFLFTTKDFIGSVSFHDLFDLWRMKSFRRIRKEPIVAWRRGIDRRRILSH